MHKLFKQLANNQPEYWQLVVTLNNAVRQGRTSYTTDQLKQIARASNGNCNNSSFVEWMIKLRNSPVVQSIQYNLRRLEDDTIFKADVQEGSLLTDFIDWGSNRIERRTMISRDIDLSEFDDDPSQYFYLEMIIHFVDLYR